MSKRNIAYIKPSEPNFIRKLKEQAGYKEGPTIDTKRQEDFESDNEEDNVECLREEQPTVVVLEPGDLTAAEAENIQKKIDKEEEEKPADLNQPILFNSQKLKTGNVSNSTNKREHSEKKGKSSKKAKTSLLSFANEEEED